MGKKYSKQLDLEYKEGVIQNKAKFSRLQKRRILIIGPSGRFFFPIKLALESGKTSLFKALLDMEVPDDGEKYEQTERLQMGLKIVNPKDQGNHPLSIRIYDSPGNIKQLKRAALYAFQKVDLIMILMDASKKLDGEQLRDWTAFALSKVYQYHRSSNFLNNLKEQSEHIPSEQSNPLESARGNEIAEKSDDGGGSSYLDQRVATFGLT